MRRIGNSTILSLILLTGALAPAAEHSASPAKADDAWLLRFNLQAGDGYRYAVNTEQNTQMDLGPLGQQQAASTSRFEMSSKVKDRQPDGGVLVDTTYDRIVVDNSSGPSKMHFDSAEPPSDGAANPMASLAGMLGKHLSVRTSARGEVTEVAGLEAVWQDLESSLPDSPIKPQMQKLMRASFGPETIKAMMQQASVAYPAGPVRTGDTWSHEFSMPSPLFGDMRMQTTYRVEGLETQDGRECVKLATTTKLEASGKGLMFEQLEAMLQQSAAGAKLTFEMKPSTAEGHAWIERASGLLHGSAVQNRVEAIMSIVAGEGQSMDMKMVLDQTVKVELQR